jgi:hypothetical protein
MIISIANSGKSPLSPPFDDAQGMLFQRGELAVERTELPNTYRAKLDLPSWISPFEKGGRKGGFEFFHSFGAARGERTSAATDR